MALPSDLSRIVEAHLPARATRANPSLLAHFNQLREEVLPVIRQLQREGALEWYCFHYHVGRAMNHAPDPDELYVHMRLAPAPGRELDDFIHTLPAHFQGARHAPLGKSIAGVDETKLKNHDLRLAWQLMGMSSEWALSLVELHTDALDERQASQFIHLCLNSLAVD